MPNKLHTSVLLNINIIIFGYRYDWELRYLHPNYSQSLEENAVIKHPCPDVYWFPIISERFADELVEEMEHYGKWSDGSNMVSLQLILDIQRRWTCG
jgi:hypothetical protein